MRFPKDDYATLMVIGIIGFVVFTVVPMDKVFGFMSKSTEAYVVVVVVAAIISVPGFLYLKKVIKRFEKNKWDK
ncbi:hypothetical protein LPW11_21860 [Geomonas sp. RF6]|uniref:hypothetical protein n=1 Tax=Geomonas sp. RF6 TaxID=2897342 RepID=UPI001E288E31|nr:hypothetical protein [Geomonas sp. RF6]UFS70503.1 hypothetical protein LPW11_21860 [Geomonas sp. RF6]